MPDPRVCCILACIFRVSQESELLLDKVITLSWVLNWPTVRFRLSRSASQDLRHCARFLVANQPLSQSSPCHLFEDGDRR